MQVVKYDRYKYDYATGATYERAVKFTAVPLKDCPKSQKVCIRLCMSESLHTSESLHLHI